MVRKHPASKDAASVDAAPDAVEAVNPDGAALVELAEGKAGPGLGLPLRKAPRAVLQPSEAFGLNLAIAAATIPGCGCGDRVLAPPGVPRLAETSTAAAASIGGGEAPEQVAPTACSSP